MPAHGEADVEAEVASKERKSVGSIGQDEGCLGGRGGGKEMVETAILGHGWGFEKASSRTYKVSENGS